MSTTIHSADPDTLTSADRPDEDKSVAQMAMDTADKAKEFAADKAQSAQQVTELARRELRDGMARANDKAREITDPQPLLALAGAMAVGVAIGVTLGSRR